MEYNKLKYKVMRQKQGYDLHIYLDGYMSEELGTELVAGESNTFTRELEKDNDDFMNYLKERFFHLNLQNAKVIWNGRELTSFSLQDILPTDAYDPEVTVKYNSPTYRMHWVKADETLYGIADEYGVGIEDIIRVNNLEDYNTIPGQTLLIPVKTEKSAKFNEGNNLYKQEQNWQYIIDAEKYGRLFGRPDIMDSFQFFPFPKGVKVVYENSYFDDMDWNMKGPIKNIHTGIDLYAELGQPIYSVSNGNVVRYGWNNNGGYRLTIQVPGSNIAYYYAHLSGYAPNILLGAQIRAGQHIGYLGCTGYGAEQEKQYVPHLHFEIIDMTHFETINPYYYLKSVENNKMV